MGVLTIDYDKGVRDVKEKEKRIEEYLPFILGWS